MFKETERLTSPRICINDRWFTQQKTRFLQIAEHLGLSGRAFSILTTRRTVTLNTEPFQLSATPGSDTIVATLRDETQMMFTHGDIDSGSVHDWCQKHLKKAR